MLARGQSEMETVRFVSAVCDPATAEQESETGTAQAQKHEPEHVQMTISMRDAMLVNSMAKPAPLQTRYKPVINATTAAEMLRVLLRASADVPMKLVSKRFRNCRCHANTSCLLRNHSQRSHRKEHYHEHTRPWSHNVHAGRRRGVRAVSLLLCRLQESKRLIL